MYDKHLLAFAVKLMEGREGHTRYIEEFLRGDVQKISGNFIGALR